MAQFLKQSTAIDVRLGPFVDVGDGFTPETGVTIAASDEAEILKVDGAATVSMAGTFAAVTGADGWYDYTLSTGDTDTVGDLTIVMNDDSVYLPVFARFQVVEEEVFDDLFAASATGYLKPTTGGRDLDVSAGGEAGVDWANVGSPTTAVDLSGTDIQLCDTTTAVTNDVGITATAVDNIWDELLTGHTTLASFGQVVNALGARTGEVADAGAVVGDFDVDGFTEATDDHFNGMVMVFTTGALTGQARVITDYTGSGQNCVFADAWTNAPADNDDFVILPPGMIAGGTLAQVLRLFITILDQSTGQVDSGSFAAGAVDAAAIAADAIGSSELATAAVNEIRDSIISDATTFAGANIDAAITSRLAPTTAGRTLDITAAGEAGIDLDNTSGTIAAAQIATDAITAAKIAADAIGSSELASTAVNEIVDQVWDETRSDHATLGSYGDSFIGLQTGSAEAGTLSTTQMTSDLTEATDDHFNGRTIVWTSGVLAQQASDITDYAGANGLLTFTAVTEAASAGDDFVIF